VEPRAFAMTKEVGLEMLLSSLCKNKEIISAFACVNHICGVSSTRSYNWSLQITERETESMLSVVKTNNENGGWSHQIYTFYSVFRDRTQITGKIAKLCVYPRIGVLTRLQLVQLPPARPHPVPQAAQHHQPLPVTERCPIRNLIRCISITAEIIFGSVHWYTVRLRECPSRVTYPK